jgi:hypothetical protein
MEPIHKKRREVHPRGAPPPAAKSSAFLAWRYFIRSAKREKYKYNIRNKREKKPL